SEKANEFADQFEKLNNDSNINGNTSYSKLLSALSDDYYNLKKACENDSSSNFPALSPVKTPPNKLLPALSTFSVIPVFLGVPYKVNNKELKIIIFKNSFRDSTYVIIKKYIIIFPFLY
ncbi:hypothetical protein YYE_05009, partial [Plasmodium vinckei vinckei]